MTSAVLEATHQGSDGQVHYATTDEEGEGVTSLALSRSSFEALDCPDEITVHVEAGS